MINLFVEWYVDRSEARQAELRTCLQRNVDNPHVSAIYLVGAGADLVKAPDHPKITQMPVWSRPTYAELFDTAALVAPGETCAIANADIHFDDTLAALDGADLDRIVLCLSRWEPGAEGPELRARANSQDAWIFRGGLQAASATFSMGRPGCDNRLAWLLHFQHGFGVCNPSRTVRAYHVHASGKRNYTGQDRLPGPYLTLDPTTLEEGLAACGA